MQQTTAGNSQGTQTPSNGTPTRIPGTPTQEHTFASLQDDRAELRPMLEHLSLHTALAATDSGAATPQARSRRPSVAFDMSAEVAETAHTPSVHETGVFTPRPDDDSEQRSLMHYAEYFGRQETQHNPGSFPPEIVSLIVQHLYYSLVPPPELFPAPDPYLQLVPNKVPYLPPEFAPPMQDQARDALRKLCHVNHVWNWEATRALWRKLSFGMPKGWEKVLRVVEEYNQGFRIIQTGRRDGSAGRDGAESAGNSGWSIQTIAGVTSEAATMTEDVPRGRTMDVSEDNKWDAMMGHRKPAEPMMLDQPDHSLRALEDTVVLDPRDSPLLYTKQISFSRFRTAGMSRSVRQGSHERFVTPYRLLTLLRGTRLGKGSLQKPSLNEDEDALSVFTDSATEDEDELGPKPKQKGKLEAVGFTEFMDSALTRVVLDELLFRGGYLAEYEEPDEPAFLDYASEADTLPSPSPSPSQATSPLPPLEPFRSRHLQSSHSRSPAGHRRSSLSSSVPEEEEEDAPERDEGDDEEDVDMDVGNDVRGRSARLGVPARHALQRRSSGSAFAPPSNLVSRDESEERGRGRDGHALTGSARTRGRLSRSLLPPPSSYLSRSSSVPAPYLSHQLTPALTQRRMSIDTERSSSVPPSVSGKRKKVPVKVVQTLEGSTGVRAIRAMDLCGCVSRSFVSALQEVIEAYKLGPPALSTASAMTAISEFDAESDDDMTEAGSSIAESHSGRKLRRTFFPHMRRLGLASTLLPTNLIQAFVLAFPFLTHLDLASTLSSPTLLRYLAMAGQDGPGGRKMRLKSLNLARCRLMTGEALVGLLCGDCPPFTSLAEMNEGESWGSGEIVSDMTELSLYGDSAYPSPLSTPELKLIISISPAFTGGHLRYLDLGSTPLTDTLLLEHFPPQPHLIVLGLANCRQITMQGVTSFLINKAPGVEVLDLSNAAPGPPMAMAPSSAARRRTMTSGPPTLSIMELHNVLLKTCASVNHSSSNPEEAEILLALRATNLRVVELDEKTLEILQGGAGDWKPIWGKGRRGWYVDIATYSAHSTSPGATLPRKLVHLARTEPRRMALQKLYEQNGTVTTEVGWCSRKMEIVRGDGMLGKEEGLYSFHAFSV
ncbi:hypothetical protein OIV83_005495 [Microbotryomycetes sp. JL201]|nr:hypothetical protein OIV83_005495 [Microbotryomycetes sp. JL201]